MKVNRISEWFWGLVFRFVAWLFRRKGDNDGSYFD